MKTTFPMTVHGKEKLEKELHQLIKVDRENIKRDIAEARALGDLKENAEYHAAKEKQSMLEGRISELQAKVGSAQVIDVKTLSGDKVLFGATVTLYNHETEKSATYTIVGEDEAREEKSKVSYSSPLARALIGKTIGDEVVVKAPKGDIEYEIENVQFI
jgi:transcription elongation factor GreA